MRDRSYDEAAQKQQEYYQGQAAREKEACMIGNGPFSVPLHERVASQLNRAASEARNVARLQELQHLLAKNPDVARILDLLDSVQLR